MVAVHKIIRGSAQWLPFAMSRLRQMIARLGGSGYASQQFTMPDGADVKVRLVGDQPFLRIDDGGASYEFYTSEPVFPTTGSSGEFTGGLDSFGVTGSGVRAAPQGADEQKVAKFKTQSLFSKFLAPADPPKWVLRDKDFITSSVGKPLSKNFKARYNFSTQNMADYAYWPKNGRDSLVTSTMALPLGRNAMTNWDHPARKSAYNNQTVWMHDEGIHVPPCYYDAKGVYPGVPAFADATVWARHAAVQSAGGRKFFICTDNKGRFQVYPVKAYPLSGYHFVASYWLATPPYPAWVTVPNPATSRLNDWHWAFNKDGTKAVSCPFNSVASHQLIVKLDPARPPDLSYTLSSNIAIDPSEAATVAPYETMPGRIDTPGLVEFGIAITVTGPGEMDFTVAFTLLRNQYALTDNRYFFDAAYSLPDMSDAKTMPWAEDTLVTSEVQMFVAPGNYAAGPLSHALGGNPASPAYFVHNANLPVGYVVISTNDADMVPTERVKLQAVADDGAYLTPAGYTDAAASAPGVGYIWRPDVFGNVRVFRGGLLFDVAGAVPPAGLPSGPETCVLSALALSSTPAPQSTTELTSFIHMRSLELRTMSMQYDRFDYRTGKRNRVLLAYNEVIVDEPQELLTTGTGVDRALLNTERVPCSAVAHHNAIINWMLWTRMDRAFSIHPAGHWGHSSGASSLTDIVSVKKTKTAKSVRSTHKAIYNKAFGQTRDYSYYVAPNPGPLVQGPGGNYKEYAAYQFGYMGGFKTNGVWVTF